MLVEDLRRLQWTDRMYALPARRWRFSFETLDEVVLPDFAGSAWRGAFGRALRDLCCIRACAVPSHCPRVDPCPYRYVFETPRPPEAAKMRLYREVPHPFVLDPSGTAGRHRPGEVLTLGVTLIGRAVGLMPHVARALAMAGDRGVGRGRGRLRLRSIEAEDGLGSDAWALIDVTAELPAAIQSPPPPPPTAVLVHLKSPLRLKEDGRNVTAATFRPYPFLASLLRRLSMLSSFHADQPFETDFAAMTAAARHISLTAAQLRWQDWRRYSSRQGAMLAMGGLIGVFRLDLVSLDPWWPILWQGQWLHTGKGTSMGLGMFRLAAADGGPGEAMPLGADCASG